MARIFLGLIVAALLMAVADILAILVMPEFDVPRRLISIGLTCLGLWLICGWTYVLVLRAIRLRECLMLGFFLGLLEPVASIALSALLFQNAAVGRAIQVVGLEALAMDGLFTVPFALFGAWSFWRTAGRRPSTMPEPSNSPYRFWQDLRKRRLALGLMLAAGLLWAVCGGVGVLFNGPEPDWVFAIAALATALILLEIWFLGLGLAYVFAVGRRRGAIRRRECLLLGTLLAWLLPMFLLAMWYAFNAPPAGVFTRAWQLYDGLHTASIIGVLLSPFGLLAGWIFWRVGVRPAPEPLPIANPAAVFD